MARKISMKDAINEAIDQEMRRDPTVFVMGLDIQFGGSFGQFLFSPLAVVLIDSVGWRNTLLIFAVASLILGRARRLPGGRKQVKEAE